MRTAKFVPTTANERQITYLMKPFFGGPLNWQFEQIFLFCLFFLFFFCDKRFQYDTVVVDVGLHRGGKGCLVESMGCSSGVVMFLLQRQTFGREVPSFLFQAFWVRQGQKMISTGSSRHTLNSTNV